MEWYLLSLEVFEKFIELIITCGFRKAFLDRRLKEQWQNFNCLIINKNGKFRAKISLMRESHRKNYSIIDIDESNFIIINCLPQVNGRIQYITAWFLPWASLCMLSKNMNIPEMLRTIPRKPTKPHETTVKMLCTLTSELLIRFLSGCRGFDDGVIALPPLNNHSYHPLEI